MPSQNELAPNENERQIHDQLVIRGREILLNAPQLFIDVDVEADGKAGYGSLLSIGAISPGGEQLYIELKPDSDLFVPYQRKFCESHGLQRQRLMVEGTDAQEATQRFADWTNSLARAAGKKAVFSAFNAAFDFSLIDLYCAKYDVSNPYGIAPFDLKSKLIGLEGEWDWVATGKGHLPKILLPEGDFTHKADEDAAYQQQMHFAAAALLLEKEAGHE